MDKLGYGMVADHHFEAYELPEHRQSGRNNWPLIGGNGSRRQGATMRH